MGLDLVESCPLTEAYLAYFGADVEAMIEAGYALELVFHELVILIRVCCQTRNNLGQVCWDDALDDARTCKTGYPMLTSPDAEYATKGPRVVKLADGLRENMPDGIIASQSTIHKLKLSRTLANNHPLEEVGSRRCCPRCFPDLAVLARVSGGFPCPKFGRYFADVVCLDRADEATGNNWR